jgi:hypothetical protein
LLLDTSTGLFVDLLYFCFRRSDKVAALGIGFATTAVWPFIMATILIQLGLEPVERSLRFILTTPLILTFLFGGLIEGFVAYLIYQKIKDTTVVKRIQA